MNASLRWPLSRAAQATLIQNLTKNMPLLRAKLDITQEEIAEIVGISRQTYSAIESGKRVMSWQVYLSLVLFLMLIMQRMTCFTTWNVTQMF